MRVEPKGLAQSETKRTVFLAQGTPVHEVDLHMRCPSQEPSRLPLEDT